jgi:hypothetical protein
MLDWIGENGAVLTWLGGASVVMFIATLVAVPLVIARIPEDYFAHRERPDSTLERRHPAVRGVLLVLKNLAGIVLILAGLAMLVLPGQGLLAILLGVMLVNFPGKYRFERWMVSRGPVLRGVNWLRRKRGRPPLRVDGHAKRGDAAGARAAPAQS